MRAAVREITNTPTGDPEAGTLRSLTGHEYGRGLDRCHVDGNGEGIVWTERLDLALAFRVGEDGSWP